MTSINGQNWQNSQRILSGQTSNTNSTTSSSGVASTNNSNSIDIESAISDFQTDKISLIELRKILTDAEINFTETPSKIEFVYNNKTYTILTNSQAQGSNVSQTTGSEVLTYNTSEYTTYSIDSSSSTQQTYTTTDLQGFDSNLVSEFFDKTTLNGKTAYVLKEGKTYNQFIAALTEKLNDNYSVSINTSNLPGYSNGKTDSLYTSALWTKPENLTNNAKTKALEYLDKNVKAELKTNFLTKYKTVLLKLGYTEDSLATIFENMYNSAKTTIGNKVTSLSNEILTCGKSGFIFYKGWISVDPKKLTDSFIDEFNKQTKKLATEANNKANSIVETDKNSEIKAEEEARLEQERRVNYSTSIINDYKNQLAEYEGASEKFETQTIGILTKYLNNEIDDAEFDSQIKTVFDSVEAEEIKKGGTTINKDGSKTVTSYSDNGKKLVENYNTNNLLTSKTLYDASDKVIETCQITYDNNNKVSKKVTVTYNNDGSRTEFSYSAATGCVTRKDYDKNGKDITVTGYSRINKGKIYKEVAGISITRTTQQMYNYITQDLDNTFAKKWFIKVSTRIAMLAITGELTVALLEASQAGQGMPKGASKEYNSLTETGYENYIKNNILNTVKKNFGYDPEDVKGYFFNSNSDLAKTMAADSDMTNFVKKNVKDLINGNNLPKALTFNADSDLHNAVAACTVLNSKLSGTTLTLTVYDLYDFDPNYVTNLKDNSSMGTIVNAAGAAAMQDGKLKPYYHITEVKIDLATLFTQDELKNLGIN